eukprot:3267685-Amphidinium_carterae.2
MALHTRGHVAGGFYAPTGRFQHKASTNKATKGSNDDDPVNEMQKCEAREQTLGTQNHVAPDSWRGCFAPDYKSAGNSRGEKRHT